MKLGSQVEKRKGRFALLLFLLLVVGVVVTVIGSWFPVHANICSLLFFSLTSFFVLANFFPLSENLSVFYKGGKFYAKVEYGTLCLDSCLLQEIIKVELR